MKRTILALAGLLALASGTAQAATCNAGSTNCYAMKDGLLAQQSVSAIVLPDGRILGTYTLMDATGNVFGVAGNPLTINGTVNLGTVPSLTIGSSALPAGAASETGHLLSIDTKLPSSVGQKAKAASLPVSLPTDPDISFASGPITAVDAGSTTTTGQNSVSLISGTPTAAAVYSQAINGQAETVLTVTGTFAGTLQFEGSGNAGTTYSPRATHLLGTGYVLTTATAPGVYHMNTAGLTNVRVRATAWTSGTATVQAQTTAGTGSVYVMNPQRIIDNVSGNQLTIKTPANTAATDPAGTVYDPMLALAIGTPSDTAWTGTGTASQIALLKGLYGQAIPTYILGSAPAAGAQTATVQGPGPNGAVFPTTLTGNTASAPLFNQSVIGGAAVSSTNPDPVANYVGGAAVSLTNPLPTSGVGVTKLHSTALEACHVFTKPATTAGLRTINVTAASSSAVFLFIVEGTAAPSTGSVSTTLLDQFFLGSNGTYVNGSYSYGVSPLLTVTGSNNFVACLSTTAPPTYTATGAIGWFAAQVL